MSHETISVQFFWVPMNHSEPAALTIFKLELQWSLRQRDVRFVYLMHFCFLNSCCQVDTHSREWFALLSNIRLPKIKFIIDMHYLQAH